MSQTTTGLLLVILCTVVEGFAQIFLKKSAFATGVRYVWLGLGLGLVILEAALYTGALQLLDVSVAFPIGSLSFVTVTILSQLLLREKITGTRWIGVGLILVGAALVATRA